MSVIWAVLIWFFGMFGSVSIALLFAGTKTWWGYVGFFAVLIAGGLILGLAMAWLV